MKQLLYLSILLSILSASCEKNDQGGNEDPDQPLVFSSLITERDTLHPGETSKIYASATGFKLTFKWESTGGDILGSGSEVVYAVTPCHYGRNTVVCTVSDGNNDSKSREVYIVVL